MKIKPIKTRKDHERALHEIDRLMDAKPNTPEGERLAALAALVEAWEDEHEPIEPPRVGWAPPTK